MWLDRLFQSDLCSYTLFLLCISCIFASPYSARWRVQVKRVVDVESPSDFPVC